MKKKLFRREREWFVRPIDEAVATIIMANALDPEFYKFLWNTRGKRVPNLWLVCERDRKELERKFKDDNLKYEIWTRLGKGRVKKWMDPDSKSAKIGRINRLILLKGNKSIHM